MSNSTLQELHEDTKFLENLFFDILKSNDNLQNYLITLIILLIISIFFVYFTAFLKGEGNEKGKIEARLASLDKILKEQENITKTVEKIKSDIEKGVWLDKEKNLIKREKITEMMFYLSALDNHIFKQLNELAKPNGEIDNSSHPISMILDINTLYFKPDEIENINILYAFQRELSEINLDFIAKKLEHFKDTQQSYIIDNDFLNRYYEVIKKYVVPITKLRSTLGIKMSSLLEEN